MAAMSAPATKALSPAPVSTTARTSACGRARGRRRAAPGSSRVQGVQRLGTVDRDDGDGAVALDLDGHE